MFTYCFFKKAEYRMIWSLLFQSENMHSPIDNIWKIIGKHENN